MQTCPNRFHTLRAVVAALAVLVALSFAFQVRDGGALDTGASRPSANHFVADAFPTAEASVVSGR